MTNGPYEIIRLPKTHSEEDVWRSLVLRQKEFRLGALKASPQSFESTYARENTYDYSHWDERLKNKCSETIIAIQAAVLSIDALQRDWVATLVLKGPLDDHDSHDPLVAHIQGVTSTVVATISDSTSNIDFVNGSSETHLMPHFMLHALYVSPAVRGAGLGKRLINSALIRAEEVARESGAKSVRVTLIVDYHNKIARNMYQRCGFVIIKRYFFKDPRDSKYPEDPPEQTEAAVMEKISYLR